MTEVKICGLTSPKDAEMVSSLGADMVGVIINVEVQTPREIEISYAKKVLNSLSEAIKKVIVTMPKNIEDIYTLSRKLDVDYFQIHSELSTSKLKEVRETIEEKIIGVISIPIENESSKEIIDEAIEISENVDLLLLDTKSRSAGGTGTVHNWKISSEVVKNIDIPLILAGGLTPSNVSNAVRKVDPYAVDSASGVESRPGEKDFQLVKKFIQEASR